MTRPVSLAVEFGGIESFPGGPRHAGFEAATELRRKEFGINLALPPGVIGAVLGDLVEVELDFQLQSPTPSPRPSSRRRRSGTCQTHGGTTQCGQE